MRLDIGNLLFFSLFSLTVFMCPLFLWTGKSEKNQKLKGWTLYCRLRFFQRCLLMHILSYVSYGGRDDFVE
jgi:hypothetical protein